MGMIENEKRREVSCEGLNERSGWMYWRCGLGFEVTELKDEGGRESLGLENGECWR